MTDRHQETTSDGQHPLVSFVLLAYNQERYIREAVSAALAQTYEPLQIVLSDDCSTDDTFEVMRDVTDKYRGPHEVVVNRNPVNLGVGAHVNAAVDLADGDLMVMAAGDDVSLPERTEVMVRAWIDAGKPPAMCSGFTPVDAAGRPVEDEEASRRAFAGYSRNSHLSLGDKLRSILLVDVPAISGCSAVYSRELWDAFPPLSPCLVYEDKALNFRACLMDSVVYLPNLLVRYRSHDGNLWNRETTRTGRWTDVLAAERRHSVIARERLAMFAQYKVDVDFWLAQSDATGRDLRPVSDEILRQIALSRVQGSWWDLGLTGRLGAVVKHAQLRGVRATLRWLPRLAPERVFCHANWLRSWTKARVKHIVHAGPEPKPR